MITNTSVIVIVIIVIADRDRVGRDWVRGEPWVVGVPALDTSFHSSWWLAWCIVIRKTMVMRTAWMMFHRHDNGGKVYEHYGPWGLYTSFMTAWWNIGRTTPTVLYRWLSSLWLKRRKCFCLFSILSSSELKVLLSNDFNIFSYQWAQNSLTFTRMALQW